MSRTLGKICRCCLLGILVAAPLALPGSGGWTGALVRGDRLVSEHRLLSATAHYQAAARFPDGSTVARLRLAQTFLKRGQQQEAADLFRKVESAGAGSAEALLGQASALDRQGDVRAGLEVLSRELRLRPHDSEAWTRLVERAARAGIGPEEIAGMLGGAPPPPAGSPLEQRGAYLAGAALLGVDSPEGIASLRRASLGTDAGLAALARELLEAAEASAGGGAGATAPDRVLLAQGLAGPALARLEKLRAERPADAEAWALAGYALARTGRLDEGEAALRRALALAPDDPLAQFLEGSVRRLRGDGEEAVRLLRGALKHDPDNPAILVEMANALVDMGDYGDGEQALRLAVQKAPESPDLRLAVARFYVDRQYRTDRAIEDAAEAVRLSGRTAESLSTLAWALALAGRPRESLGPLLEAVAKDPESPVLRYRLASVYEAHGERARAREQYLMVGELDGSGNHWRRASTALEQLK